MADYMFWGHHRDRDATAMIRSSRGIINILIFCWANSLSLASCIVRTLVKVKALFVKLKEICCQGEEAICSMLCTYVPRYYVGRYVTYGRYIPYLPSAYT